MSHFCERHKLPKFIQEEIDNQNSFISIKEAKFIVSNLSIKKTPDPDYFTGEFYPTCKEKNNPNFTQSLPENRRERNTSQLIL